MTAGQHKGAMLLTLLQVRGRGRFEAVVYDDDNIRHVAYVFAAVPAAARKSPRSTTRAKTRT